MGLSRALAVPERMYCYLKKKINKREKEKGKKKKKKGGGEEGEE